ncbi:MAG: phosphoglycerate mutase family protein [Pseudomonadota bacterium]
MTRMMTRRCATAFGLSLAAMLLSSCVSVTAGVSTADSVDAEPLKVFLVRHAEKQAGNDPALTEAGTERAEALADLLRDAGIMQIHSSDYRRTRDTAAPLADRLGLSVALYDPRDLPGMADVLRTRSGTHLVVGHSNTTPPLVELLGGDGGEPIVEATEYDRLYLVSRAPDGSVSSVLLRYGAPTG